MGDELPMKILKELLQAEKDVMTQLAVVLLAAHSHCCLDRAVERQLVAV